MSKLISEYSTKLKSFRYLSYLLLLISVTYLLSGIIDGDKQSLSESVSIGLLGIFAGGFLFYFAQKKRTIQIYDDKIEYLKPKIEINLLLHTTIYEIFKKITKK